MSTGEILLIQDNPDDAELTIYALRNSGIANNISHIADGRLGLERLLDDTLQVPMLVLLDPTARPGLAQAHGDRDRIARADGDQQSHRCREIAARARRTGSLRPRRSNATLTPPPPPPPSLRSGGGADHCGKGKEQRPTGSVRDMNELTIAFVAEGSSGVDGARDAPVAVAIARSEAVRRQMQSSAPGQRDTCVHARRPL